MDTQLEKQEYINSPIQVGDYISYKGKDNGSQDDNRYAGGYILDIKDNTYLIKGYEQRKIEVAKEDVKKNPYFIGRNPMKKRANIDYFKTNLRDLLRYLIDLHEKDFPTKYAYGKLNCTFNPTIFGKSYQRDYVWDIFDETDLIRSLFNGIDIGKFVIRTRPFDFENLYDVVDGKQRLICIIKFLRDEFPVNRIYYSQFSDYAKDLFLNRPVIVAKIPEYIEDEEVKEIFISINTTGKGMSRKHLEYVKTLK